jgi:hypothetical protein
LIGPPEVSTAGTGPPPGLCGACRHSRIIDSRRGSTFRLCERSATDPRFPRYPTLPVLSCQGYEPGTRGNPEPLQPS